MIFTPVNSSSSAIELGQIISAKSSLVHKFIGVPQNRFRLIAQSRASRNQFAKRLSRTKEGTLKKIILFFISHFWLFQNQPICFLIIGQQIINQSFHFDKPRGDSLVDEWSLWTIAEWIIFLEFTFKLTKNFITMFVLLLLD